MERAWLFSTPSLSTTKRGGTPITRIIELKQGLLGVFIIDNLSHQSKSELRRYFKTNPPTHT
jgi:hypothetical protein